jgi:hypothetical protein
MFHGLETLTSSGYHTWEPFLLMGQRARNMNEFVCPYCGDSEIAELSWCVVLYPVARWTDDGVAEDYREAEVDWASDMPYGIMDKSVPAEKPVYECRYCAKQFRKPSRAD